MKISQKQILEKDEKTIHRNIVMLLRNIVAKTMHRLHDTTLF